MTAPSSPVAVRHASAADAQALAAIYNYYIANTVITFEEQALSPELMAARIEEVGTWALPWLVVEEGGRVLGYAYAGKWKGRCAYRYTVETSVYLDPAHSRRGLGRRLYEALLDELRQRKIHVAIGGVALPNAASVALHEACGFRKVAHFDEVGFKFGQWLDVGYWQRLLD